MPNTEKQYSLITDSDAILALAETLKKETIIAYDTEFIREKTFYPVFEILQIATREQAWLIDIQAFIEMKEVGMRALAPLFEVLEDPKILKVVHAAQADQECFYTAFRHIPKPLVDTAQAASLLGYGENLGLGVLIKKVLSIDLPKGHARTHWSKRPLSPELLNYAALDVIHLVALAEKLLADLEKVGRKDWALELSQKHTDPAVIEPPVDEVYEKIIKGKKIDSRTKVILRELLLWREARVRLVNRPRKWVADDTLLLDLARGRPKTMDQLSQFRAINSGEVRSSGEAILKAVAAGLAKELSEEEKEKQTSTEVALPTSEEQHMLDLLKIVLSHIADRNRVPSGQLLTAAQQLRLIRSKERTREAWIKHAVITERAGEILGAEFESFMRGELVLRMNPKQKGVELCEKS